MGSELKSYVLGDLGSFRNGANYSKDDYGDCYPVASVKNLFRGRFVTTDGLDAIKQGVIRKIDDYLLKKGDLLFARSSVKREGSGQVAIVNEHPSNCIFSGFTIRFRTTDVEKVDPLFLLYLFRSPRYREEFTRIATGTTIHNLSQANLAGIEVELPCIESQRKLAHILDSLDQKIELNRQINTTLESMAQALFKSWFVDFDPVIDNALAAGNEIPDALQKRAAARAARREALRQQTNQTTNKTANETTGATDAASVEQALPETGLSDQRLPSEIQQLFPDRFVFTEEMGWVPEGWEVALSGDLIDVRDGTHDSPKKSEVGYPLVTSKHITSGRLDLANTYLISEKDYDDVNKRSKVETGDILLTMIGTVGIPYLVMEEKINFAIKNIGLFRTSTTPEFKYYFFLLLGTHGMQTYLDARMAGTTQKYLSLKVLRNLELIKPASNVLQVFNSIVDSWFQKKAQTEKSSATLADLRDSLLPKLLSGQITIPEAEQQLAEVL